MVVLKDWGRIGRREGEREGKGARGKGGRGRERRRERRVSEGNPRRSYILH